MVAVPAIKVLVDFDRDGTYETNLAPYLDTRVGGFTVSRGTTPDGKPQISEVSLKLNNADGRFTRHYSSGPYYAYLAHIEGTPMQVQARDSGGTYRALWTGYVRSLEVEHGRFAGGVASLKARDIMHYISEFSPLYVTTSTNVLTSTAFTSVCTALALSAPDYSPATGKQTLPLHYAVAQKGLPALMQVTQSEMGGQMFVKKDGVLRFEARDTRLGATPTYTWGDGTSRKFNEIGVEHTDEEIVTSVEVTAQIFAANQGNDIIAAFSRSMFTLPTADSLGIAPGVVWEGVIDYGSPIVSLTTPVAGVDYKANSQANGQGTDKTSSLVVTATNLGASCRVRITHSDASTVYVTYFRLRGQVQSFSGQNPRFAASKSNTGDKILRGITVAVPFADDTRQTRDYPYALVRTFRVGYPRVTLSFPWAHNDILDDMTALELGTLVRFTDTANGPYQASYIDDLFYVQAIKHIFPTPGSKGVIRSEVTLVPSTLWRDLDHIVYDDFDRSNGAVGTSRCSVAWANATNFNVASNKGSPTVTTALVPTLGAVKANVIVEASLGAITSGASAEAGVVYRYQDASNYWRAYVSNLSDKVYLEKVIAGVVTTVAQPAWTVVAAPEIRAVVQGDRHRVYVDDVLYIDTTDSALNTKDIVGLYLKGATTTTVDDYYAQGL